jgi:hypothetical protein
MAQTSRPKHHKQELAVDKSDDEVTKRLQEARAIVLKLKGCKDMHSARYWI